MGSLGGDNDTEIRPIKDVSSADSAPARTQPFDSPILHSSFLGEKSGDAEGLQFLRSPLHFNGTVPVDYAFETQVLNLGGETQVLDDLDCPEYMGTQVIDEFDSQVILDSDGEGTDTTEVLGELSGDELGTAEKCKSFDGTMIKSTSPCKESEKRLMDQPTSLNNQQHSSGLLVSIGAPGDQVSPEVKHGSVPRFTSVRVESLRASARNIALKGTKNESHSLLYTSQLAGQHTVKDNGSKANILEEVDGDTGGYDNDEAKGLTKGNKCKIGCSTVRKLFSVDPIFENKGLSVCGKEGPQPNFDDRFPGLSYIDSQEPGELSQANALAFVERLIDENKELSDFEVDTRKSTRGKSSHISTAKGPQCLAKITNDRGTSGKAGIFDWDDGREDEGGGDIFRRRKEEFFGMKNLGRRCFTEPKKPKVDRLSGYGDKEGKSNVQNEIVVRSDSKITLHDFNRTKQDAEVNIRKNLVNEFDEQPHMNILAGELETTVMGKDIAEMLDVGLDTQIAAEAMEALFNGEGAANHDGSDAHRSVVVNSKSSVKGFPARKAKKSAHSKQGSFNNNHDLGVATRLSKKTKRSTAQTSKLSTVASKKHPDYVEKENYTDLVMAQKRAKKRDLQEELATSTPVAHRTRKSMVVSQLKSAENVPDRETNCPVEVVALEQNRQDAIGVEASTMLNGEGKLITMSHGISCPRRRRSLRSLPGGLSEPHNLDAQSKPFDLPGNMRSVSGHERSLTSARINGTDLNFKRRTRSSISASSDLSSVYQNIEGQSPQIADKPPLRDGTSCCTSADKNGKDMPTDFSGIKAGKISGRRSDSDSSSSANKMNVSSDHSPKETTKPTELPCTSPVNCMTPVNAASPVCMGNGYFSPSCKKNLSRSGLMREISGLCTERPEPFTAPKNSRRRRDLTNVRVLFSHHLDEDVVKQQRKILDRLKLSIASSITEATHFITDKFVRTRNMLEAIASGKPVVTHLWLENVGRANYYIDEERYILRDTKKEKEFGFNMPVSLAQARQHPLLQGWRVFITPNSKPGKEIISSLVKAVHGQAVERVGRYALKDDMVPDDLLILSCEEDYDVCVPFLEKGSAVYSSELLLNGIVTQKLEYERHLLFVDHVKRTRSTIWLKKDGHKFVPVTKNK